DRTDFMEVNVLNRHAMDTGFGVAQTEKDSGCGGLSAGSKGGAVDHLQDVRKVAMLGRSRIGMNPEFRRGNSAAGDFLDLETRAGIEALKDVENHIGRSP